MNIYTSSYTGYVYIWYDTKAKLYYIGGHYGKVEDKYICSNKPMKRAYTIRPHTFKIKILEYVYGDTHDLRKREQKYLDMIKDNELLLSENVKNGTARYYNVKKNSVGGNGKGTNKGKSSIGGWNRGLKNVQEYTPETKEKISLKKKIWWANNKSENYQKPLHSMEVRKQMSLKKKEYWAKKKSESVI